MRLFVACLLALSCSMAHARLIDEVEIADTANVTQGQPPLQLNGAATRYFFGMVPVYVGALYLAQPSGSASQIIEQDSPKRMEFVLRRDLRARKIADALSEALVTNLEAQEIEHLQPDIDALMALYGNHNLKEGQISSLDYLPGEGTRLIMNGESRGVVPGKALYDALLKVWIGRSPVSREFKAAILGGSAPVSARFDSAAPQHSVAPSN